MADGPTQIVSFPARRTNSSPAQPAPERPKNSEPAQFLAVFNFIGVLWLLWSMPIVGALLAFGVAYVSWSLSGVSSDPPNRWLLLLCVAVSLTASAAIVWGLISNPPKIPAHFRAYRAYTVYNPAGQCTSYVYSDPYQRSLCRERAAASIGHFERRHEPEQDEPQITPPDFKKSLLLYVLFIPVLAALYGLATRPSAPVYPAGNWQPPYNPPVPEDPDAKIKREGFARWLPKINTDGSGSVAFDTLYGEYLKSFGDQFIKPPIYDKEAFKKAFKDAAGKEPIDGKYQGVSLPATGIA